MATVPNVVGLSLTAALAAMVTAGLLSNVQVQNSNSVAAGLALSTNPVAGAIVPAGDSVIIQMSAGPQLLAGNGYDKWGQTGGDQNAVSVEPPLGQNLSYAVQPENAVYVANQSVLAALARGTINQNTPAYLVPVSPKMGA